MKKDSLNTFLQYTLTTDIYRADLQAHAPKNLVPALTEAYDKVIKNDKSIIIKLLHWINQYPQIPQFKNFLSLYYSLNGDNRKASQINDELLKDFPDYLYGKLNLANFYLSNDEPEKVPGVLGTTMELCDLYPDRKVFHHEEYLNFYQTVGRYYCKINEPGKADAILDNLYGVSDLLDIDANFETLENEIVGSRLENIDWNRFEKRDEPSERLKPTLPQTRKPPVFHYPQISWLYQYSLPAIPPEKIGELLSLEKEWLRIDLETVVYDAIRRFTFFEKQELDTEPDSCLHALYLLKEIKAEESLSVLLELLRQPERVLDFWLFDVLTENIWQVIYVLGLNQPGKLADFLKEPYNHSFARSEISVALTQIVLHHPERRNEIIALYKDVIHFLIINKANEAINDPTVVGLMLDDIIEFNGKELLPEIKMLFDEDIAGESVSGGLQEIIGELDEIPAGEYDVENKRELQNYFEIKADVASWEAADDDEEVNEEIEDDYFDDWEEVEKDETQYFYSGDKPFVRGTAKVGRNEPCPCGSGKKYKHCHGVNE